MLRNFLKHCGRSQRDEYLAGTEQLSQRGGSRDLGL